MGGFEWLMKVPREKGEKVKEVIKELRNLAEDPLVPKDLGYWAWEFSHIEVILPEEADVVYLRKVTPDGNKIEGSETTFKQYFSSYRDAWPGDEEALLYSMEIPWLWKLPATARAGIAECFERHGALDIWWGIVGDYDKENQRLDKVLDFLGKHGNQIFGQNPDEIHKNKPDR